MKNTLKTSAAVAIALLALGTVSSVSAATEPSTATSTGKIKFLENDQETKPVDPNNPDNPVDPDNPIDPDDPDNNGTGNVGPLSLDYVSNIDFGEHKTNGVFETFNALNATPYLQVSDSREVGNWQLSAAVTKAFTNPTNGSVLTGAVMNWNNGEAAASENNSSVAPAVSSKIALKDASSVSIMKADESSTKNVGKGTWVDRYVGTEGANTNVTLDVPGGIATAGTYTGEVTWTLTDAIV